MSKELELYSVRLTPELAALVDVWAAAHAFDRAAAIMCLV